MEDAIEQLQTNDTKERMAGVLRLQDILEQSRKGLSANEVGSLVDASLVLLKDNNFRVSQGTLQALASAAALAGDHLKLHLTSLLPAVVERLGDGKQPVRDAGRQLLLALMEISSPTIVVERARSFAWGHRKWRVREEFARTVASAVNLFAATELPFLRMLLPSVLSLLEDSNSSVREAAMLCLEVTYQEASLICFWKCIDKEALNSEKNSNVISYDQRRSYIVPSCGQRCRTIFQPLVAIRSFSTDGSLDLRDNDFPSRLLLSQFKDITCRLDNIEPVRCSFEGLANRIVTNSQVRDSGQCLISERKLSLVATTARRSSLRVKPALTEAPIGGGRETGEHQVDAIRVQSEKELVKEIEKAAVLLTPDQDWSVRIAAMQRIEGLVAGGAAEYSSFNSLMKQLVGPLNGQLSDRRSSIVKQFQDDYSYFLFEHFLSKFVVQACQLLSLLSKELLVNFETFAESFIPVLFKLVVITVLVIAESADICIKTMLRYCRVSRVLPKLVECAKHDRNAVLRARCCEYALLVLEQWGDSPEIQRSVDLYEELIKCCVGDAVSEVRCSARTCYRLFSKCWPERVQRMFITFDASVQRLLNEEGVVSQKRYAYPSVQEWGYEQQQPLKQSANMPVIATRRHSATLATPAHLNGTTVNAERSMSVLPPAGIPVISRAPQGTLAELVTARSLERVLQASQQQVNAIENMLKGGEKNDNSGTRAPGSRDVMAGISDKGALSMSPKMALRNPGGSFEGICGASVTKHVGMDHSSACDRPYPTLALASHQIASHGARKPTGTPGIDRLQGHGSVSSGGISGVDNFKAQQLETSTLGRDSHLPGIDADRTGNEFVGTLFTVPTARRVPHDKPITNCSNIHYPEIKGPKRVMRIDFAGKSAIEKKQMDSACIPGFQRPLLRQRSSGSARNSVDENSVLAQFNARGEMHKYTGVLMPLTDALIEGLSANADWSARVAAFTYLKKVLQQGVRGLHEINQSFGMAMKLFSAHLDDPHHKVTHAALSTLAELVPVCRKPFEAYLERILPVVFGRLVDAKEVIRQLGSSVLEIVGNTYSIDSVLPALLRSLDEQRSPKVKMAVIEFATVASAKLALNRETSGGTGLVKLWLAKLGPLAHDKNPKLKEAAVTGIISVYSQFDSTIVLNFILGLSIEEQSLVRRSLKQYTPRIEVDLMTYIQNKSQRGRFKFVHENAEPAAATPEISAELWTRGRSRLSCNEFLLGDGSSFIIREGSRKWESSQHNPIYTGHRSLQQTAASELTLETFQSCESSQITKEISGHLHSDSFQSGRMEVTMNVVKGIDTRSSLLGVQDAEIYQCPIDSKIDCRKCPSIDCTEQFSSEEIVSVEAAPEAGRIDGLQLETQVKYDDKFVWKVNNTVLSENSDCTVTNLLQQLTSSDSVKTANKKHETLLQLMMSRVNYSAAWSEHFNQIVMVILESMENSDVAVKELVLSATFEMLNNQNSRLADFTAIMLQKLLQSTMDSDLKVSTLADRCRTIVLTEFDPLQCLPVLVQLLISDDQKTLVTCISSLTMLVSRLLPEDLVAQLPSFLPALFKAFGNQNADVRKTVVFCLVDIYIVLGEAFVPYLRSLSSTQLRLVTIYATRISQAKTGTSLESGNL